MECPHLLIKHMNAWLCCTIASYEAAHCGQSVLVLIPVCTKWKLEMKGVMPSTLIAELTVIDHGHWVSTFQ